MYGEGRIAGVIEIFKRGFSFCERTGAFSLIKTKIVKKSVKKVGQPFHSKFPQSLDSTGFFIFVKIGSEVHRLFYRIFSNLLFECPTLNFYRKPKISMQSIAAFISSV